MKKNHEADSRILILNDKYVLLRDVIPVPESAEIELDLGCGKGDFAVALASRHPERTILAADVMLGRLRKVIRKASDDGVNNLYFLRVEARHLLSLILPDNSLTRLHILCPDPWPKYKHKGNRLLSSDIMAQIARVLKPGAVFHFSTDDEHYLPAVRKNVADSGLFESVDPAEANADMADVKTEFECQWLAMGKTVTHLTWHVKK